MLNWFSKAVKTVQDESDKSNAAMQGSNTDHHMSPYQKRMTLEPMHGDELAAFEWVIKQTEKQNPKLTVYRDLIDQATDDRWLYVDKDGMLRVSEEAP